MKSLLLCAAVVVGVVYAVPKYTPWRFDTLHSDHTYGVVAYRADK